LCQSFLAGSGQAGAGARQSAKVKRRKRVRGLREIARRVLATGVRRKCPRGTRSFTPSGRPAAAAADRPSVRRRGGGRGAGLFAVRRAAPSPPTKGGRNTRPVCPWRWRSGESTSLCGVAGAKKRGRAGKPLRRLAGCIDRGLTAVADEREGYKRAREGGGPRAGTAGPGKRRGARRRERFESLQGDLASSRDGVRQQMAVGRVRFLAGYSWVGGQGPAPRQPGVGEVGSLAQGHERRGHGHRHGGVRLVRQGAALIPHWMRTAVTTGRSRGGSPALRHRAGTSLSAGSPTPPHRHAQGSLQEKADSLAC